MGSCLSFECATEASWKPFVTTTVKNVVTNTLISEPTLWMVKDCACKKCTKVNKRQPTEEEYLRHGRILDDAKLKTVSTPRLTMPK